MSFRVETPRIARELKATRKSAGKKGVSLKGNSSAIAFDDNDWASDQEQNYDDSVEVVGGTGTPVTLSGKQKNTAKALASVNFEPDVVQRCAVELKKVRDQVSEEISVISRPKAKDRSFCRSLRSWD